MLIQFDGEVLEAERSELPWLRGRLEALSERRRLAEARRRPPDRLFCACAPRTGTRPRAHPLRRRHGRRAARIGRNHHAISDRVGGRGGHHGPTPSAQKPGPASRSSAPTRIRTSCSRPAPPAGARSTTRSRRSTPGAKAPSAEWKVRYALLLGLERVLSEKPPHLASGTELRRHQVDALAGMLTELIAADAEERENGNGNGTPTSRRRRGRRAGGRARARAGADDDEDDRAGAAAGRGGSRRGPALPLPPSDRVGQDDRRRRLRRGRAHRRRPDPHAPPPARRPVPPRADRARLRRRASTTRSSTGTPRRARRTRSRSRPTRGSRATSPRSPATRTSS